MRRRRGEGGRGGGGEGEGGGGGRRRGREEEVKEKEEGGGGKRGGGGGGGGGGEGGGRRRKQQQPRRHDPKLTTSKRVHSIGHVLSHAVPGARQALFEVRVDTADPGLGGGFVAEERLDAFPLVRQVGCLPGPALSHTLDGEVRVAFLVRRFGAP